MMLVEEDPDYGDILRKRDKLLANICYPMLAATPDDVKMFHKFIIIHGGQGPLHDLIRGIGRFAKSLLTPGEPIPSKFGETFMEKQRKLNKKKKEEDLGFESLLKRKLEQEAIEEEEFEIIEREEEEDFGPGVLPRDYPVEEAEQIIEEEEEEEEPKPIFKKQRFISKNPFEEGEKIGKKKHGKDWLRGTIGKIDSYISTMKDYGSRLDEINDRDRIEVVKSFYKEVEGDFGMPIPRTKNAEQHFMMGDVNKAIDDMENFKQGIRQGYKVQTEKIDDVTKEFSQTYELMRETGDYTNFDNLLAISARKAEVNIPEDIEQDDNPDSKANKFLEFVAFPQKYVQEMVKERSKKEKERKKPIKKRLEEELRLAQEEMSGEEIEGQVGEEELLAPTLPFVELVDTTLAQLNSMIAMPELNKSHKEVLEKRRDNVNKLKEDYYGSSSTREKINVLGSIVREATKTKVEAPEILISDKDELDTLLKEASEKDPKYSALIDLARTMKSTEKRLETLKALGAAYKARKIGDELSPIKEQTLVEDVIDIMLSPPKKTGFEVVLDQMINSYREGVRAAKLVTDPLQWARIRDRRLEKETRSKESRISAIASAKMLIAEREKTFNYVANREQERLEKIKKESEKAIRRELKVVEKDEEKRAILTEAERMINERFKQASSDIARSHEEVNRILTDQSLTAKEQQEKIEALINKVESHEKEMVNILNVEPKLQSYVLTAIKAGVEQAKLRGLEREEKELAIRRVEEAKIEKERIELEKKAIELAKEQTEKEKEKAVETISYYEMNEEMAEEDREKAIQKIKDDTYVGNFMKNVKYSSPSQYNNMFTDEYRKLGVKGKEGLASFLKQKLGENEFNKIKADLQPLEDRRKIFTRTGTEFVGKDIPWGKTSSWERDLMMFTKDVLQKQITKKKADSTYIAVLPEVAKLYLEFSDIYKYK